MTTDKSKLRAVDHSALEFHKSKRSNGGGTNDCLEVAKIYIDGVLEGAALRDSKDPSGPCLYMTVKEMQAYNGGVEDGDPNLTF